MTEFTASEKSPKLLHEEYQHSWLIDSCFLTNRFVDYPGFYFLSQNDIEWITLVTWGFQDDYVFLRSCEIQQSAISLKIL